VAKSEIIVGLDIGTTKVCAVVGEVPGAEYLQNGAGVEILAVGMAPSTGVKKGIVVDIDATVRAIREAVEAA